MKTTRVFLFSLVALAATSLTACGSIESGAGACKGELCSEQGICVLADDQAVCLCDEGFVADGLACVVATDACDGETCSDNGTCALVGADAQCLCDEGFVADGLACVLASDACDGETCSGNGDCVVNPSTGAAFCACDTGFIATGLDCLANPSISLISPPFGGTDVDIDTLVQITFSKAMSPMSVQNGLKVLGPTGEVSGQIVLSAGNTVATFTPEEPLVEFESLYSVTLSEAIVDAEGVRIDAFSWNFTTVLVDASYFYRLQTQGLGPSLSLDTFSGTFGCLQADTASNTSGQFWRFQSFDTTDRFFLSNSFQPDLLLEGGGVNDSCVLTGPFQSSPAVVPFTGQIWNLVPVVGHPTNCTTGPFPYFFLQNEFLGTEVALDSTGMRTIGCSSGQFWRPVRDRAI